MVFMHQIIQQMFVVMNVTLKLQNKEKKYVFKIVKENKWRQKYQKKDINAHQTVIIL